MHFSDPVAAFNEALRTFEAGDWAAFGECFDSTSIRLLREMELSHLRRCERGETGRTLEKVFEDDWVGVGSIEQLEAMSAGEFYAAYISSYNRRARYRHLVADGKRSQSEIDALPRMGTSYVSIGWISEGKLAYVLFREPLRTPTYYCGDVIEDYAPEDRQHVVTASVPAPELARAIQHQDRDWKLLADFTLFQSPLIVSIDRP